MSQNSGQALVDVFPINTDVFGFNSNWFEHYVPMLIDPAYLLMTLLLVISVGIMVLRRFERVNLEKKVWNIPVIITVVGIWPMLVLGLKELIDTFNTFLVQDVFQIAWDGFGFPAIESISVSNILGWSADGIARLLPNLSYWLIYAFYIVFFFFFAVLGPFVLAKGILFDEIEAFLELVKEITILFLWQTTVVILVAFIMPVIVSGKPFPDNPDDNFYFLSLILGIMMLFVPSLTRKFANHLGSSFFPAGFRWGGAMLGLTIGARTGALALAGARVHMPHSQTFDFVRDRALHAEEFRHRYSIRKSSEELKYENDLLEKELAEEESKISQLNRPDFHYHNRGTFIQFSKRAYKELSPSLTSNRRDS